MPEAELSDAIEIIPGRLYWTASHTPPKNSVKLQCFSIDTELVYEPFFQDFGPLNLAMVDRYCKMVEAKLTDPTLTDKRIVHYCSPDPKKRANAATLICAYQVVVLGKSAEMAYEPFTGIYPPFLPFRDATCGLCSFQLTILDCIKGLEFGIQHGWFDRDHFDVDWYEFREKVENGDMNWIIPEKFLAFAGPSPTPTDMDGFPTFTPDDYAPIFRQANVGLVVRLNKELYDRRRFIDKGIKHSDLYFLDGSCPSKEIVSKFLEITEKEQGAIAVHCKAGLGRTGTLIGLYAMKHYGIPARSFIGWIRICRPGSILGPQQQFLLDMQAEMFQAGAAMRLSREPSGGADAERALAQQVETFSLKDRTQAEQYEDVGQGERLCNAKRSAKTNNAPSGPGAPLEIVLPPIGTHGCRAVAGAGAAGRPTLSKGRICA
jgi:cell division cycle 14